MSSTKAKRQRRKRQRQRKQWTTCHKRNVAIHEAAHAVLAIKFGRGVPTLATIRRHDETGSAGRVEFSRALLSTTRHLEKEIVVCYAGFAAERKLDPDADRGPSFGDYADADDLIRRHPDWKQYHRLQRRMEAKAAKCVDKYWPEVCNVALALTARKRLTSAEIQQAMDESKGLFA